jgi:hypothetical protein
VRDDVVEWRYHVFINDKSGSDYICYDSWDIIQWNIPESIWISIIEKLISQYEQITNLSRFDDLQCPNIEFQLWDDWNIYFLQYKRWHQKSLTHWTLDRELEDWEIEAEFVRWFTKQWGEEFEMRNLGALPFYVPLGTMKSPDANDIFNSKLPLCLSLWSSDHLLSFHWRVSQVSQSKIFIHVDSWDFLDCHQVKFFRWIESIRKADIYMARRLNKLSQLQQLSLKIKVTADGYKWTIFFAESLEEIELRAISKWYNTKKLQELRKEIEDGTCIL